MNIREKAAREIRLAYCGKGARGTWEKMAPELQAVWILMATAAITTFLEAAAEQGWHMQNDDSRFADTEFDWMGE